MFIPSEDIQRTGRKLGKGQFGVASVAVFMNREVCVKTHHIEWDVFPSSNASVQYGTYGQTNHNGRQDALYGGSMASGRMRINEDLFKDIFNEALAMKPFEHENVMKLIGFSLDQYLAPELILPLMDKGDLKTYLGKETNTVSYKDAIKFALDSARGMNYLSDKNVIHRDLAARNCLLETTEKGKINLRISDFGLSKHLEEHYGDYDVYDVKNAKTKLPIKWLAPEVLREKKFTTMSDVWAYGVLV